MKDKQRRAMFANMTTKPKPSYKMGIDAYSKDDIAMRKAVFGIQGTGKYLGTRCMHCGGNDATFRHKRANGTVKEVRCIRCSRNAGM